MRYLNAERTADNLRRRMADDLADARVGGAGLASTLPDYVRFAEMLCRGGSGARTSLLFEQDVYRSLTD